MAALAEVRQVSGIVVDDGTWIHTRVVCVVKEVLKDRNRPLRPGGRLQFEISGGEVAIGKVLVKAWDVPKLQAGRTYFVFAAVNSDTGVLFPNHVPMLVDGDILVSTQVQIAGAPETTADPLNGFSLGRLLAEVHRLTK